MSTEEQLANLRHTTGRVLAPGEAIPGKHGEDWGLTGVTRSYGFIPGIVDTPSTWWTCHYCGRLKESASFRCSGCGAERRA